MKVAVLSDLAALKLFKVRIFAFVEVDLSNFGIAQIIVVKSLAAGGSLSNLLIEGRESGEVLDACRRYNCQKFERWALFRFKWFRQAFDQKEPAKLS